MFPNRSIDNTVRLRLKQWPQQPPGSVDDGAWLKGRPDDGAQCFLKMPGSERMRTLPDGLWLNFSGTPAEPFVDILAIEACGSLPNLLDKRSRFAPSTQSLMAVCPLNWLLAGVTPSSTMPRWRATGLLKREPKRPFVLPVRDMRVLYGLNQRHYRGFSESIAPHPHEYFVPVEALMAQDGDQDPAMRALVARTSVRANFFGRAA